MREGGPGGQGRQEEGILRSKKGYLKKENYRNDGVLVCVCVSDGQHAICLLLSFILYFVCF
eukprot:763579-Hanusia_phi.AAC.1